MRAKGIRLYSLVLLLTVSLLYSMSLWAQTQPTARLEIGHDFWGFRDNAPQGTLALAQTSDGFLWLGTPLGLYRFDGTRFELFHSPFGDQLLSTNIYALMAPPSGGLWIGYAFGGFSFLNDGRVTNYGQELASPTGTVNSFTQNGHGVVWAATTSGLWKFDDSHWQHIGPESNVPPGPIRDARFDQEGTLWTLPGMPMSVQQTKLVYLRPGSSRFQTAANDLNVSGFSGFTLDADGRVVTSPENRGGGDLPSALPVLRKNTVQIVDRTKSLWVSYARTLLRVSISGGIADTLNKASSSNSETYNVSLIPVAKLVDREGNIWFGEQGGIHRFSYSPLIRQDLPKSDGGYFTVTADDQGAVWITAGGGDNPGLFRVANGEVKSLKFTEGDNVQFTYRSPDKTVWFGRAKGLWRLVNGSFVRVYLPKELADQSNYLQTVTRDSRGGMWVSFGRHGLYRLADGVWTPYGGREDLPKTGVVIEFTDSLGRVWFGYTKGQLAVLDGDHVQVFGPNDGIRVGNITAIYGRGPEIWIGGEFGLQQFDHGRFHNIQATDTELLRGISGIVETSNGDLWLNGLGGIFHLRRSEIAKGLQDSAYQVKGEHFGTRQGLPGYPFQLRPLNTAIEGTDGRIWFATSGGVVWLDPERTKEDVPPPRITIQSVSADDKNYPLGAALKFPAHTSSVLISYAAISLSDPTAVHFRYKLQESDKDWHEVAGATPVSYRNLAPGSYHFNVMATDTNGVWSDRVAVTEFAILPAFYQTGWFRLFSFGVFTTLLWVLYRMRLRQLARHFAALLEERVSERTRIARELHDTLLQSFHGSMLRFQAASNLLATRPTEAKLTLDSAIDEAAQAITEGRDTIEGLRSSQEDRNDLALAIKSLGEELAAREAFHNSALFHVDVTGTPRSLQPMPRDEVYRIAGEALRNALRHAQAKRIEVEIRFDDRELQMRVRDDGKGIGPEVLQKGGHAGHFGLHGMSERARLVGGRLDVWSEVDSGTEIELCIPASIAYAKSPAPLSSWLLGLFSQKDTANKQ